MTVAAVVLAAGASTRYGGVKQRDLLPAVLAALDESSVDEVVVVTGAHALEPVSDTRQTAVGQVSDMCQTHRHVRFAQCEDWAAGPGASLRCGLGALAGDVTRAVVVLADGPNLDPRAVERLLAADAPYAAASYDGSRSHPVALARSEWDDIPDEGLRGREPVLVDCSDLRPPGDVDYRR